MSRTTAYQCDHCGALQNVRYVSGQPDYPSEDLVVVRTESRGAVELCRHCADRAVGLLYSAAPLPPGL